MRSEAELIQAEASFLKALLNYDRARWTSTTLASLGIVISLVILGLAVKTEIDGRRNHPIVIAQEARNG